MLVGLLVGLLCDLLSCRRFLCADDGRDDAAHFGWYSPLPILLLPPLLPLRLRVLLRFLLLRFLLELMLELLLLALAGRFCLCPC
jgi:hypothetical protein